MNKIINEAIIFHKTGNKCVLNAFISDNTEEIDDNTLDHFFKAEIVPNGILKPEYRGYSIDFWNSIRTFYALEINWTNNELNDIGRINVQKEFDHSIKMAG